MFSPSNAAAVALPVKTWYSVPERGREPTNDQDILALFNRRDETAIDAARTAYGKLCFAAVRHILPDQRDAEECVSDAYLRAWNAIPPEQPASLGAYLARITRNLALDRYDYQHAEKRSSDLTCAFEELEAVLPTAERAEDAADRLTLQQVLNDFLRAQTREARTYFIRRYWYGESISEIAAACRAGEGPSGSRCSAPGTACGKHWRKEESHCERRSVPAPDAGHRPGASGGSSDSREAPLLQKLGCRRRCGVPVRCRRGNLCGAAGRLVRYERFSAAGGCAHRRFFHDRPCQPPSIP